ncbi:uncharacterized protein [Physcomitrium patens]|uniref:Uncharacterized protein n=2 Tax=Physcomitrium patens TaxID=3218 RepID=A0A2K1KNS6_PHYPA|nr:uncharacterized protein LOC112280890 isoform X1 [Physcomitrium patens]PNR55417.1 hypothetical protein PHYPA_006314 [Physcomitrium patens]|eukprot:XP_024372571.1 uncharacterized protein LOC112280890 isoform X1 [Physcomitrella patens]
MAWQGVSDARWRALLDIFRNSTSAVQTAVRWVETQGYGDALGKASTQGNARGVLQSLSRFVPELLAKPVVVIEEQHDNPGATVTICNELWIQTLPNAMQTNILTFLSAERRHFLSKDLVALASTLLATRGIDFWVKLAASNLLNVLNGEPDEKMLCLEQNCAPGQNSALEQYSSLPSWIEEYKELRSVLLSGLTLRHEDVIPRNDEDPLTQEGLAKNVADSVDNNRVLMDEVEISTARPETCSQTALGKRKRDPEPRVISQATSPHVQVQESQGPEETMPGGEHLEAVNDEDEKSVRELLGNDLFEKAKSLGIALQSRSSHDGLPFDIDILSKAPNLSRVLKVIKPWLVTDETTSLLVTSLLGEQSGYAQSTQILTHVLLPKLINMEEPPSRILSSAVLQAGKAHPRATIDAVVIPLLLETDVSGSTLKCDLINRVVKECFSPEAASSLCNRLFCPRNWVWTDGTVGVVQTLLNQKVSLEEVALEGLISLLELNCNQFSASLKFSNLLLNLVTKYGSQVRPYKQVLQQVVSSSKTFLTKSILTKVSAL